MFTYFICLAQHRLGGFQIIDGPFCVRDLVLWLSNLFSYVRFKLEKYNLETSHVANIMFYGFTAVETAVWINCACKTSVET